MFSKDSLKMPKLDMDKFDFSDAANKFWEILKLNKKVIAEVAGNEKYNAAAMIFITLGAFGEPLGLALFGGRFFDVTIRADFGSALMIAIAGIVLMLLILYISPLTNLYFLFVCLLIIFNP